MTNTLQNFVTFITVFILIKCESTLNNNSLKSVSCHESDQDNNLGDSVECDRAKNEYQKVEKIFFRLIRNKRQDEDEDESEIKLNHVEFDKLY